MPTLNVNVGALSYKDPTPMSVLMTTWIFPDVREYVMPYEKRCYFSHKTDLSKNGWVNWATSRVDSVLDSKQEGGLHLSVSFQPWGGKYSMLRQNPNKLFSAHSWRDSITMWTAMDCFYEDGKDANPKNSQRALQWAKGNDACAGPGGVFDDHDRRLIASSYARENDPYGGGSLDALWDKYYDSQEKYNRLVAIKRRFDPNNVFTPNAFCIGSK